MRPHGRTDRRPAIEAVAVVIPARNEEAMLGAALESIAVAASNLRRTVRCAAVVVLDRCTDRSADVLAAHTSSFPVRLVPLRGAWSGMGAVRSAGVARARILLTGVPAERVWVASTDADSTVPPHWLTEMLDVADGGIDLVLGTVEPRPDNSEADRLWRALHLLGEGHTSIHGANLGVRLAAYDRAGGSGVCRSGEDADLTRRVRESCALPWRSTDRTRVLTSARRQGRADGGFAQFLQDLDAAAAEHPPGHLPLAAGTSR